MDNSDAPTQINFRTTAGLKAQFAAACERNHRTQAEVLEQMMTAYTAAGNESAVRHLNGDMCPLSQLLNDLARHVREKL